MRVVAVSLSLGVVALAQAPPPFRHVATEHLGSLTPPNALAAVGLAGTDLGVSFPRGDDLVFLFGDSWTLDRRDWDVDSVATVPNLPLRDGAVPALRWRTRDGGRFAPFAPAGLSLGGMNVPVDGIAIGTRTYVFFDDGWDAKAQRHSHSICGVADGDDLTRLEVVHRERTDRFVNVSLVRDGDVVWIFGSGSYRKSAVFLARAPAAALGDRAEWRYWPDFTAGERTARPLVASDCVGELSVRRLPGDGLWVMAFNATLPRGIHVRLANSPTGPWSEPLLVFDPSRDGDRGYGHTMHQACAAVGYDDGLSEPGREEQWGGEYGPYLVPEWCATPAPGVVELVYTLSTWNPYTVRLLRSTLVADGVEWRPEPVIVPVEEGRPPQNLTFANGRTTGWRREGDAFAVHERDDGVRYVCTWTTPRGDAVQGRLWQEFVVPENARELRGVVWGGDRAVQLWCGDERVRATRGLRSNDVDVRFRWRLDAFRGRRVRLEIVDDATAPWGFVSVSGLELVE